MKVQWQVNSNSNCLSVGQRKQDNIGQRSARANAGFQQ